MTQKAAEFAWDQAKHEAAQLLAEDELTDEQIATKVGHNRASITRWKKIPEFAARVKAIATELGDSILQIGIARRSRRVKALNDRWERLQRVIEARSQDPAMQNVAGGKEGVMVRTRKVLGSGPGSKVVSEFAVDTGLLKELRDHEKQAAQELGQWVDKIAPTNPDGTDEYDAGNFADHEVAAILKGLAARLGLEGDGSIEQEPEMPPGSIPP